MLFVEGKDDVVFFDKLLSFLQITDVQIVDINGKGNFKNLLTVYSLAEKFSSVTHLAYIRDADEKESNIVFNETVVILNNVLPDANFPTAVNSFSKLKNDKLNTGIFALPGLTKGMLEDLCWETIPDNSLAKACVEKFMECAKKLIPPPKNLSKAKIQAYLATKEEIANSISVAAEKNYWDFSSPSMDDIKTFLRGFNK